jgi:hypothetical protein
MLKWNLAALISVSLHLNGGTKFKQIHQIKSFIVSEMIILIGFPFRINNDDDDVDSNFSSSLLI